MPNAHQHDHTLISEAISEDWLASERILVHLAREHGFTVEDASNAGLAALIVIHDTGHGDTPCFPDAEASHPDEGLRRGLLYLRERRKNDIADR